METRPEVNKFPEQLRLRQAAPLLRGADIRTRATLDLPWRQYRTPYRVFLAEQLLIRTRADVVARIFEGVVEHYPTVDALAEADETELAAVLEPLGLRKRVPLLIRAARYIVERHDSVIPSSVEELMAVPGLGRYTATAIAAFAFDSEAVPADVNILRFVSRLTGLPMEHSSKGSKDLRSLLPLLSKEEGGPSAEALLDFTRLVCRPLKPKCERCPVRKVCAFYEEGED